MNWRSRLLRAFAARTRPAVLRTPSTLPAHGPAPARRDAPGFGALVIGSQPADWPGNR